MRKAHQNNYPEGIYRKHTENLHEGEQKKTEDKMPDQDP